ncbi:MAG: type I-E CRISPR-associated protein Cse1/CasA, partial [Hyphomicrobium sp.]
GLALGGELRLPARCVSAFFTRAQEFEGEEKRAAMNSRLLAAGYAMDNMKPLDFGEALMPLIVTGDADSDDRVRAFAEGFVKAADLIANQLGNAVKRALFGEKAKTDRDTTVLDAVRQRFWGDTEQAFYAALRHSAELLVANKDDAGERLDELRQAGAAPWLAAMRNAALAIFDDTAPIEDADSSKIKDVIEGRKMLVLALTGYGPVGAQVFAALGLPAVETKAKKGRKAA